MARDLEIEIQVQVEKIKALLDFLAKKGKFVGEVHQVDQYFTPAHRNFIAKRPADEWLRLRDAGGKYSINYKNWHHNKEGQSNSADEYETRVENLAPLQKLFAAIDIKPITVVDKKRQIWLYKDYEIAIDKVKNLGDFVEIEYKGKKKNPDPDKIAQEMIAFLKKIGCGQVTINYQGYPFLLLFPNETKWKAT